MKKIFVLFLTILFSVTSVSALDLVFNVEPAISFPSQKNYSTAFGGTVQADVDLMNFMTAGVEGGFIYEKPVKCDGNLNTLYGGINLGFYYYPLSRLYVGLGGSFGVDSYISSITKDSSSSSFLTILIPLPPPPAVGLRIIGYPTFCANFLTSSIDFKMSVPGVTGTLFAIIVCLAVALSPIFHIDSGLGPINFILFFH